VEATLSIVNEQLVARASGRCDAAILYFDADGEPPDQRGQFVEFGVVVAAHRLGKPCNAFIVTHGIHQMSVHLRRQRRRGMGAGHDIGHSNHLVLSFNDELSTAHANSRLWRIGGQNKEFSDHFCLLRQHAGAQIVN
jgi:hypothetical protein